MADGTRLKDLQEAQKRLDQILQTESLKREASEIKLQEQIAGISDEMQGQMGGLNSKYEHLTHTLAAIQLQLLNLNKAKGPVDEESILGGPSPGMNTEGSQQRTQYAPNSRMQVEHPNMHIISPIPKLDFPRFDGTNPRSWILKCSGYFKLIPNIPDSQKVTLASMHFEGKAAQWYQSFCMKQVEWTWQQFVEVISARFEELKEVKIIAEFNKLKHTGSYNDYVDKFEELKACMLLMNNGDYSEEYFVASFISGLSEELQSFVNMFEPTTLQQTIDLGRKQIQTLEAITRKMKPPVRSFAPNYNSYKKPDIPQFQTNRAPPNPPNKPPVKLLTASEMAQEGEGPLL
ncbi:hypothetical protein DH2020_028805 [Rehmannia glutinosa]|uniref:Ty3 transposon capsid-like protein domain-containing protein n=1 Tax=Rehmannia glutinosa TaxID=99300 RepID=A0ABR0VS37_REHGL